MDDKMVYKVVVFDPQSYLVGMFDSPQDCIEGIKQFVKEVFGVDAQLNQISNSVWDCTNVHVKGYEGMYLRFAKYVYSVNNVILNDHITAMLKSAYTIEKDEVQKLKTYNG